MEPAHLSLEAAKPHLLTLPYEIRHQILREALLASLCENESRPYATLPYGRNALPFDKPLHPVFSSYELNLMAHKSWHHKSSWGCEPMTRIMRACRQLYEEVYQLLWGDFVLHLAGPRPRDHSEWMAWLQEHNPRAIETVRHLQIRVTDVVEWCSEGREASRTENDEKKALRILKQIESYPNLTSVRFQIYMVETVRIPNADLKARAAERIMRIVKGCTNVRVSIFWEPDVAVSWAKSVVEECQARIGQSTRTPTLYRKYVEDFAGPRKTAGGQKWSYMKSNFPLRSTVAMQYACV